MKDSLFMLRAAKAADRRRGDSSDLYRLVISICAFSSIFLNIWLVHTNVRLRETIDSLTLLRIGQRVDSLLLKDRDGKPVKISYAAAPKGLILYYFSPSCGWCVRNSDNLNALFRATHGQYQFVTYTADLTGLSTYSGSVPRDLPVLTDDQADIRKLLNLSGTPQTIEFDRSGVVVANWQGAYTGRTLSEIERRFGVRLPGISNK